MSEIAPGAGIKRGVSEAWTAAKGAVSGATKKFFARDEFQKAGESREKAKEAAVVY